MSNTKISSLDEHLKSKLLLELTDFYIPYRNTLNLDKNVTFGCEIEFNIPGYSNSINDVSDLNAILFMKDLGYLYPYRVTSEIDDRIELITGVLQDEKDTWDMLKEVLKFLINNGAYYSGKGGSHVHVGNQLILNDFDLFTDFLKLYACYENEIIRFTNGEYYFDRKQFDYMCARTKTIIYDMLMKKDFTKYKNISRYLCQKMTSINFPYTDFYKVTKIDDNIFYYDKNNTTEFRTPTLTLNPVIWQNNINLFTKIMTCLRKPHFDKELLDFRYNKDKKIFFHSKKPFDKKDFELCDLVFDNDFDKHCFLRQYYKDFNNPKSHDEMEVSNNFTKKYI